MDNHILEVMEVALNKAKDEYSKAIYQEECGANAGIRKMNANKAEWLRWLIYLAERGFEYEKQLVEAPEASIAEDTESECEDCPVAT